MTNGGEGDRRINRRQFVKTGAAIGVAGMTLEVSQSSVKNRSNFTKLVHDYAAGMQDEFPAIITDKCRRMNQKNTVFCRSLWDQELVKKVMAAKKVMDNQSQEEVSGWTPLDQALYAAGWAIDHKFATGSEGGQPHSQAYAWDEPVYKKKFVFKSPEDTAKKVKKAARYLGASLVGIARYDPLWTYSNLVKARMDDKESQDDSPRFEIIPPAFPFEPKSVVIIAVEMDYHTIALSPSILGGAATGRGYSLMSTVGYSTSAFLRQLGYKSFSCGNDVSLSIPYAVAAGLGELGRNGMLITQEFGPRVRLVKVFTELEIRPDRPKAFGVRNFCKSCKRCAEICPPAAISFGHPTLEGNTISNNPGVLKWYIDPEKCIQFWTENGSDCSNCITSCPYNKPDMWHHQLSSAAAALPLAPLHALMARIDKLFGYGTTYDLKSNADFWNSE